MSFLFGNSFCREPILSLVRLRNQFIFRNADSHAFGGSREYSFAGGTAVYIRFDFLSGLRAWNGP